MHNETIAIKVYTEREKNHDFESSVFFKINFNILGKYKK